MDYFFLSLYLQSVSVLISEVSLSLWKPHLPCPFSCQWIFKLLPYFGCCKQVCNKYRGECILSGVFLWINAQEWYCWIIWQFYFQLFKEPPDCSFWWLQQASLVAQMVKNLPAMPETQIRSLGREDLLEKGMATHSRILTWRIQVDRGADRAAKSQTLLSLFHDSYIFSFYRNFQMVLFSGYTNLHFHLQCRWDPLQHLLLVDFF